MYMYQQKSTITNLLGKQHFNSNNEYIGGKHINRYIQQGISGVATMYAYMPEHAHHLGKKETQ